MEFVNCILCGIGDTKILFSKKDKFGISTEEFNIVECKRCGLLYINPRPSIEEMNKFYPETYSWKETLEADSSLAKLVRRLEKSYRYHLLKDEVSKVIKFTGKTSGRVLDIGCGTGDRLEVFRRKGFETFGVEPSDSADYGREYLKLNIIKGDLFSANFPEQFFDIITLYNVLEHTHNPVDVCNGVYRVLKEDGFLIIQLPNKDCLQYKIFRKRWSACDVPRDLYYFNIPTMDLLCKKTKFQIKKVDHFMNWWHPPTFVNSLFPNLEPQKAWLREGSGQSTIFQRMGWVLLTLLAGPLTQLESILKYGAILTYYIMKDGSI